MRQVEYVAQEHKYGCTAAAVAMVVGKSYDEVQRCCWMDFSDPKVAIQLEDWYPYLFQEGFTFYRVWRVEQLRGPNFKREVWPPEPFAPVHLCGVANVHGGHAVVMLGNGDVLDPAWPGVHKLHDYPAVHVVIGCFPKSLEEKSDAR